VGTKKMGEFLRIVRTMIMAIILFSVAANSAAHCAGNMIPTISGPCINRDLVRISFYEAVPRVMLARLWMLDNGAIHPPLELPYLVIEKLAVESLWGLRTGESLAGDPRWDKHKQQPKLEAIALLRNREMAMSSRMIGSP